MSETPRPTAKSSVPVPRSPTPPHPDTIQDLSQGVCRLCGCTQSRACVTDDGPCAWADHDQTLCTACAVPPVDQLRERCYHVVELLNGQEFAEDLKGGDVQCLTLWAWSPAMVDQAQRERVIAFFAGREQACIDEGDTEGGTDARARAVALIEQLEGQS